MPRLFWKLFFALWLSIMAFAIVVSWINHSIILRNAFEEPATEIEASLDHLEARLARDLEQGGVRQATRTLRGLPRGMRKHVFVLDAAGNELLGREAAMAQHRQHRIRIASKDLKAVDGRTYTLLTAGHFPPPRALLEPGSRGVGLRLAVAAVISAIISFLLARYLAAPLGQLSHASRRLATGDLGFRVGPPLDQRKDEFGQLAIDLDEMAARLQILQRGNRRLLRDVSHELRSPLARLRVALEIARNKDQSVVAEELDRMELESHRLEILVDEVLSLLRETSGPQQLKLQHFDLSNMLQDLVESVNYELTEGQDQVALELQTPLFINADRELLWRVFENLLRNAVIHSGDTGGIQVTALLCAENEIHVSVKDSGPGIAEVHLERIFEPFYRVDEARARDKGMNLGGHGLGLAIAASAVRRHGGTITASNHKTGGLEVTVVLRT